MILSKKNFLNLLQDEFDSRKNNNVRYSLRSFAKSLNLEPSLLSKILRSKYKLTPILIKDIGRLLQLTEDQITYFIKMNDDEIKASAHSTITEHEFAAVSNTISMTLIWLVDIVPVFDFSKLALKFKISESEVKNKLDFLVQIGILECVGQNMYRRKSAQIVFVPGDISRQASAGLIKNLLDYAKDSIDDVNFDMRSQTNLMLTLNKSSIALFEKKIHEFLRSISKSAKTNSADHDSVYNLIVSLHPMYQNDTL